MDSKDLEQLGFKWYQWRKLTSSGLPFQEVAVYAIKSLTTEARRKGYSDILYVGSSKDLWKRFFHNYIFGSGGSTTKRIHKKLKKEYLDKTEVGWVTSENFNKLERYLDSEGIPKQSSATKYEELEKRLKLKFKKEHGEYPPWNKKL